MRSGDESPGRWRPSQQALDLLPAGHADVGLVFINRGNVHLQRGDARAAVADFARGPRRARPAGDSVEQAKAEHNLGYARLLDR